MAALWGSLTSLAIGFGDLAYAKVSARMALFTLMILGSLGGVVAGALALFVVDSELSSNAVAVGFGAGAVMSSALALYLQSLKVTSVSVAAPITAVLAAVLPMIWEAVVDDALPSGLVAVGAAVALGSLALTTLSPESTGRLRLGVQWAALAGVCYGVGNIVLGQADEAAGVWPAIILRVTGMAMFFGLALRLRLPRLPPAGTRRRVFVGGMLGSVAVVCFLLGVETGELGVLSVTASLFPAVSVTLLFLFAGHPLRWWQVVGVTGAIGGVALIAVG